MTPFVYYYEFQACIFDDEPSIELYLKLNVELFKARAKYRKGFYRWVFEWLNRRQFHKYKINKYEIVNKIRREIRKFDCQSSPNYRFTVTISPSVIY